MHYVMMCGLVFLASNTLSIVLKQTFERIINRLHRYNLPSFECGNFSLHKGGTAHLFISLFSLFLSLSFSLFLSLILFLLQCSCLFLTLSFSFFPSPLQSVIALLSKVYAQLSSAE